ncbi:MAG: hypothetical protein O9302_07785 [Cyclobacteriaceae bacterium]|nr:hypothetical protein [Cytophagales bacterium]MCZ8327943.1 hypothetical protein [Cyclobacteriaceae bacterium]
MKKTFFQLLAAFNKVIVPRASKLNLNKLSKSGKLLIAYRYWVTTNALD